MNAPATTWFKNVWRTSDSLEFNVVFTGCTIPGEFLEKRTWFSFLRGKPNLYTSKPFCEPNQLLKSGKDWGTPFKAKILFQTKCGHSLQCCFCQGCAFLLCSTAIPLITSPTGWMNPEGRQIPPQNYRQISWSPRPTQADRQVTHGVKYVVIHSDFCANLYKAMTVPLRCNSLNKQLR